jgi:hypothetical protein
VDLSDEASKLWNDLRKLPGWLAGDSKLNGRSKGLLVGIVSVLGLLVVTAVLAFGVIGGNHTAGRGPKAGTTSAAAAPSNPSGSTTSLVTPKTHREGVPSTTSTVTSVPAKAGSTPTPTASHPSATSTSSPDTSESAKTRRADHSEKRATRTKDRTTGAGKT